MSLKIQEVKSTPNRTDPKKSMPRHSIVKFLKRNQIKSQLTPNYASALCLN